VLASIIPGLRDFRTPFAAGMIWIVAILLVFADFIPRETPQEPGLLRELHQIGNSLIVTALLAILGFLAYFIGLALTFSVPQQVLRRLRFGVLQQTNDRLERYILRSLRLEEMADDSLIDFSLYVLTDELAPNERPAPEGLQDRIVKSIGGLSSQRLTSSISAY